MSADEKYFQPAAQIIAWHVDTMPTGRERGGYAAGFAFASVDLLRSMVGDESTLHALQMMIEAIESRKEPVQ